MDSLLAMEANGWQWLSRSSVPACAFGHQCHAWRADSRPGMMLLRLSRPWRAGRGRYRSGACFGLPGAKSCQAGKIKGSPLGQRLLLDGRRLLRSIDGVAGLDDWPYTLDWFYCQGLAISSQDGDSPRAVGSNYWPPGWAVTFDSKARAVMKVYTAFQCAAPSSSGTAHHVRP